MKKTTRMTIMLMAAMAMMTTACSEDDALSIDSNSMNEVSGNSNNSYGGSTNSSLYAEMETFTVSIDKTTEEPTSEATAQYPGDGDAPSANSFTTLVNIDMSNPVDAAIDGVTIKVDGQKVTADHGNAEKMVDEVTGQPYTAHTVGDVQAVLINAPKNITALQKGKLADIAPTLLDLLGIEQPKEMTGESIIR